MSSQPAFEAFTPPFYLRSSMLQTFLGSNRPGESRWRPLHSQAAPLVLHLDGGIRLNGAWTSAAKTPSRGLIILMHGWEGSISSTYVMATGWYLLKQGLSVFRLNLRDHGDSHHLNSGLFYATLLDEVYQAVMAAARRLAGVPVFLCGFSLGGNFALRIARKWSETPEKDVDLRHVVAVSPALDPSKATDAIDRHRFIQKYFLKKWCSSLLKKQRLFPEIYDFGDIVNLPTIREMTEKLLQRYSKYPDATAYFKGYTLGGNDFKNLSIPTTIVTAADDPIIPVDDFYRLPPARNLRLLIHSFGGHNGFIRNWRGGTWYEKYLVNIIAGS